MNKVGIIFILSLALTLTAPLAIAAQVDREMRGEVDGKVNGKFDIVVVVNPSNPTSSLSRSQVIDMYMGKYVAFPDGRRATPIDATASEQLKRNFYQQLVGMSLARINAYWSRIKFSGRARPPIAKPKIEIIAYLNSVPNAIAYIPRAQVDNRVKVVFSFNE